MTSLAVFLWRPQAVGSMDGVDPYGWIDADACKGVAADQFSGKTALLLIIWSTFNESSFSQCKYRMLIIQQPSFDSPSCRRPHRTPSAWRSSTSCAGGCYCMPCDTTSLVSEHPPRSRIRSAPRIRHAAGCEWIRCNHSPTDSPGPPGPRQPASQNLADEFCSDIASDAVRRPATPDQSGQDSPDISSGYRHSRMQYQALSSIFVHQSQRRERATVGCSILESFRQACRNCPPLAGLGGGQWVLVKRTVLPGVDTDRWQGEAVPFGRW